MLFLTDNPSFGLPGLHRERRRKENERAGVRAPCVFIRLARGRRH